MIESDGRISAEDIQERLRQVGSFKTIKQIKKNLAVYDWTETDADFCEFLTLMLHDLNLSNPQETLRSVFLTFDEDTDEKSTAAGAVGRGRWRWLGFRYPCGRRSS